MIANERAATGPRAQARTMFIVDRRSFRASITNKASSPCCSGRSDAARRQASTRTTAFCFLQAPVAGYEHLVVDVSVWLFDVSPACCIAREFINSTSDGYDATDMARIDETRERAAAGERGLLVDVLPLPNLLAYSHSDVPFLFILQSCNFSFNEHRAAMVFVDARVKLRANHVLLASGGGKY